MDSVRADDYGQALLVAQNVLMFASVYYLGMKGGKKEGSKEAGEGGKEGGGREGTKLGSEGRRL